MKKRILALALAGTTAFSVFGAAMSANAANWWEGDSSHIGASDGAYYEHYEAPGPITWNVTMTQDKSEKVETTFYYAGKQTDLGDPGETVKLKPNTVYSAWWVASKDVEDTYGKAAEYMVDTRNMEGFFANVSDFAKEIKHAVYYVKDGVAYKVNADGTYDTTDADTKVGNIVAETDGDVVYFPGTSYEDADKSNYTDVTGYYFVPEKNMNRIHGVLDMNKAIAYYQQDSGADHYLIVTGTSGKDSLKSVETDLVRLDEAKFDGRTFQIVYDESHNVDHVWAGYDKLDPTSPDYDAVMANPVLPEGEVYGYDYFEMLPYGISNSDFVNAWNNKALATLMSTTGLTSLEPELGFTTDGLRGDVIYNWVDFLDSLGIYNTRPSNIAAWAEQIINNYAYQYYDDDVIIRVDSEEYKNEGIVVYYVTGKNVDVYNFAELIEDIANMATADAIDHAQTSEMVYLMQQYNKYMDGYVEPNPVETDEWGDLLAELIQAPTEDDFRNASSYRRYTEVAEALVEEYQEATTSMEITRAETKMFNFVTGMTNPDWDWMNSNGDQSTANLGAAIDRTVFNYNWMEGYDGNSAEVYPGYAGDWDGVLNVNAVDPDLGGNPWKSTSKAQSWALYPADDYADATGSYTYPGVGQIQGVNNSYAWFVAVYNLAYNTFGGNDFQGTLDVMTEALDEAVTNLAPTARYNAHASDILGAEEANEDLVDLVETDYAEAMWANKTKISDFITNRVSSEEIGETGTNNAEDIAELMATHLGYQRNQSNVTRVEINNLTKAMKEANTALEALQDDEDNYNAAQANALKLAIDDCQYIIDLYNGDYASRGTSQTVNTAYNGAVGDKDQILKSDVADAIAAVDAAINFKNIIQGWSKDEDGNWKYGVEDTYDSALTWGVEDTLEGPHYLNFGWAKIGNTWFYFDDEGIAKQSDWLQVGNDWYYFNKNCGAAIGWAKVDDQWYYFNQGCKMMTGWQKVDGNWYYLKPSGAMATGWCQVDGKWYYLSTASNSLGQMYYSTTTPDGYKVDASGALVE